MPSLKSFTPKQLLFKELFVGTLIYAVVLGFFNDYTGIVYAASFSWIFLAAVVLEVLTYLAFMLKKKVIAWLSGRQGMIYKVLLFFTVWLIMFLSKFIFVGTIDLLFGDNITIYGFFGILAVVVTVTVVHTFADMVFDRLGGVRK